MLLDPMQMLLEFGVYLASHSTNRAMSADISCDIDGEYVVFIPGGPKELYRGQEFNDALKVLNGENMEDL